MIVLLPIIFLSLGILGTVIVLAKLRKYEENLETSDYISKKEVDSNGKSIR